MEKYSKVKVWIVIVFLLLLVSCSKKPEYIKIDNIAIKGVTDSLMLVSMDYVVYNPNDMKTKLKQSGISIYYKDTLVGNGELNNQISLKPNDTVSIPVRCEVRLDKLSRFYPDLLHSDSAAFTIKGENKVRFMLNSIIVGINETIYLNTKEIIRKEIDKNLGDTDNFRIKSIAVHSIPTFDKTRFNMVIEAKNNLPFDYEISQINLQFIIDGKGKEPAAYWAQEAKMFQKAYHTTNIPIEVVIDNVNTIKNTKIQSLLNAEIDFIVAGEIQIEIKGYTFIIPVNDQKKIDIKKFIGL